MVLKLVEAFASAYFPTQYLLHIIVGIVGVLVVRAFSQGRKTTRERNLHAGTILVTGGFTPLGLTILQSLAQRGARIIALSPYPIDSENVTIIISLLRSSTSNEQIFAEECDLSSPSSIRSFCTRFVSEKEQRLDTIVLAHEYRQTGAVASLSNRSPKLDEKARETGSLATFLITTLLLPVLLVAPVERDIRIINVVNPFYAAAAGPSFHLPSFSKTKPKSIFVQEGTRALRTIILTRHLQRILDALPAAQVPKTDEGSNAVPVVNPKAQKSNIVAITVSPGISRVDTMAPLLNADWTLNGGATVVGVFIYLILQPLLRILTKTPAAAIQTVLHALFLPTPFKVLSQGTRLDPASPDSAPSVIDSSVLESPEEVLKPGALYAECAVVQLKVPPPNPEQQEKENAAKMGSSKGKGKSKAKEEVLEIADDGEYGGELAGRLVWEAYEEALKIWEKENPAPKKEESKAPDVDRNASEESKVP